MKRANLAALWLAIAGSIAIAGCASGAHPRPKVTPVAASTSQNSGYSQAPAPPPDNCIVTLSTWGDAGATAQFNAVNDDVQQLSSDISSASGYDATILADAYQLESDARAAQADPPPRCSGVSSVYYRAMTDFAIAGHDIAAQEGGRGGAMFERGIRLLSRAMARINNDLDFG